MKILGFNITREKAAPPVPVYENRGGWFPLIRESYTGAWQRGETLAVADLLTQSAVHACMTLIASDIAKLRIKLVRSSAGIWQEVPIDTAGSTAVLAKPNGFQSRIQFLENWLLSKLAHGNAYILKQRGANGVVRALYVLHPNRVKPMVAVNGETFYQLAADNISGLENDVLVPASEIIHDRYNCVHHPLVGTSPIVAAAVAATQGLNIQSSSSAFFANRAVPSGILLAPGTIDDATAERLKTAWEEKFGGANSGRIAGLGDGLKYEPLTMTAEASQLVEQLKWTAEVVCSVFHVPAYKVGVGPLPSVSNVQSLNVEYYSQCLQRLIEDIELCLDEGLGLVAQGLGTELDVDNLLRMDSTSQIQVLKEGVAAGIIAPNEARRKLDLPPVPGGESPMAQQQNFSLAALAKRDAKPDPFETSSTATERKLFDVSRRLAAIEDARDFVRDEGVWKDGQYTKGAGVTWAGSYWIAQRDNTSKPDAGDGAWRLAVKRGRDAKGTKT